MPLHNPAPYTDKIADADAGGLSGATADSAAYTAAEIERHLHSWQRWMGLAAVPSGETHRADSITTVGTPFQVDAGNDTWGTWYQFIGSADTPAIVGSVKMDMDMITVVAAERATTTYLGQVAWGASGAAAFTAGTYSDFVYWSGANVARAAPSPIKMRRAASGSKGWIRIWAVGANTGTLDFFAGGHEYEG